MLGDGGDALAQVLDGGDHKILFGALAAGHPPPRFDKLVGQHEAGQHEQAGFGNAAAAFRHFLQLAVHKLDDFLKPEFLARVAGYKILAAVKGNGNLGGARRGR